MIKRTFFRLLLAMTISLAVYTTSFSAVEQPAKKPEANGKKKLLLFAKNPANWTIIRNGAGGTLIYRETNGIFAFKADGLLPGSFYTLIRFADAGPNVDILAAGTSDRNGKLELNGTWRNWSKKFWLVPTEDLAISTGGAAVMVAWRPGRYLFEEKPLGIVCDCPEPEEP